MAAREEVHVGGATILSNIAGEQVEEYQVEITHVYPAAAGDTRNRDGAGHRTPASWKHWRNCPGDERQSDYPERKDDRGGDACVCVGCVDGVRNLY